MNIDVAQFAMIIVRGVQSHCEPADQTTTLQGLADLFDDLAIDRQKDAELAKLIIEEETAEFDASSLYTMSSIFREALKSPEQTQYEEARRLLVDIWEKANAGEFDASPSWLLAVDKHLSNTALKSRKEDVSKVVKAVRPAIGQPEWIGSSDESDAIVLGDEHILEDSPF